ncbi:hypothetical protein [Kineosporia sp. A_224]|uniref:hypothetical protein n=1 Tax=Kineosporia sp. A_224 TaxID=1962180 RepID=UPI001179C7CE|nr:hypothetical protein [Kineosporia sp. A_224]
MDRLSEEDRRGLPHADWAQLHYEGIERDPSRSDGEIHLDFLYFVAPGTLNPVTRDDGEAIVDVVVADGRRSLAFRVARSVKAGCVEHAVVGWDDRTAGRPVADLARLLKDCPSEG